MTDPTSTTDDRPAEDETVTAVTNPGEAEPGNSDSTITDDGDNANTEAAKYRRRLRDTETQLQTTSGQLAAYQRRAAEHAITGVLATPADLFDVGNADLTQFIDDAGQLRTNELIAAATALAEQRPQLGVNYSPPWPADVDFGMGVRSQSVNGGATWAKALAPERRNR